MSFFRRAGAAIARIIESAADPAPEANRVLIYAKDAAGVTQLYALASDGTITQLSPAGAFTSIATEALSFSSEDNVVLPAGLTSNWNPGARAVIRVTGTAPLSMVDGLVPAGDPLVGNELRLIKNVGAVPVVLVPDINSLSAAANQFQLPHGSAVAASATPLVLIPNQEVVLQSGTVLDGGKWRALGHVATNPIINAGESITPAAFAAGNVNDYNPVDAVTGVQGRFAGVWRLQGAVGTVLTGIEAAPPGLPPFVHGDRILLINYASSFLIAHQSISSAVGNKITCPPGGANNPDYTMLDGATVWIYRDGLANGWIVEGARV